MKPAEAKLPSETEVIIKRSFDAPAELVWRAYMEADLMRRWCGGPPGWSMPVCEMDMRVGGRYNWRWRSEENGQEFGFTGEVREVVPHAKIVHTQIFDPGNLGVSMGSEPSVITVTFEETGGITAVTTSIKYTSQADRDQSLATGMTDGMEMSYKRLDALLAEL
ncbi:MAG: SRPBCC family protein [Pyrinomonadaceae bacterium]|nr:SRPBCC family protein [Pyrinomonadaceae bacterium]